MRRGQYAATWLPGNHSPAALWLVDRSCSPMDDPDLDREIARIRGRLTSLEAERAELVSRLAGLERGRQEARSLSPPRVDDCGHVRDDNSDFGSGPENRTVPLAIRWPAGRLPSPLGERSDAALRLCPGLCERMGEGGLRQTAGEVRRVPEPGLHPGVRRSHRTPPHRGKGPARGSRRRLRDGGLCVAAR